LSSRLLSSNVKVKIYKTIILPVVLYGCETWSVSIGEAYGLRVSENRVLRRIFGPKRDEVTGEWRKLQNEELHNFYSSPDIMLGGCGQDSTVSGQVPVAGCCECGDESSGSCATELVI
jgi:hypothetical protein